MMSSCYFTFTFPGAFDAWGFRGAKSGNCI